MPLSCLTFASSPQSPSSLVCLLLKLRFAGHDVPESTRGLAQGWAPVGNRDGYFWNRRLTAWRSNVAWITSAVEPACTRNCTLGLWEPAGF